MLQGERIEATIPRNLIDKFKEQLEEGIVYGMKNFKVIPNTRKCRVTTNKFRILMCEETRIGELFVKNFPERRFCFKSFEEVQSKDNLYEGYLFGIYYKILIIFVSIILAHIAICLIFTLFRCHWSLGASGRDTESNLERG